MLIIELSVSPLAATGEAVTDAMMEGREEGKLGNI